MYKYSSSRATGTGTQRQVFYTDSQSPQSGQASVFHNGKVIENTFLLHFLSFPISFPLFTSSVLCRPLPSTSAANCCSILPQLASLPLSVCTFLAFSIPFCAFRTSTSGRTYVHSAQRPETQPGKQAPASPGSYLHHGVLSRGWAEARSTTVSKINLG